MTPIQYLPGLAFLILVSGAIAIPCVLLIKRKFLAIVASLALSTIVLKTWAYLDIGGFDLTFLTYLLIVGFLAATSVSKLVTFFRRRFS